MAIGFGIFLVSQILASFSHSFYLFLLSYSFIGGVGLGMNVISFINILTMFSLLYQFMLDGNVIL